MAENNAMNVRIVDGDDCCPQAMCVKVCNLVQEVRKTGASKKLIPSEKAVSDALKGRQELLVAGAAEGILGPSAATGLAQVLTAPSAGVSIVDAIKGRTLKWNQVLPAISAPNWTTGSGGTTVTFADGVATFVTPDSGSNRDIRPIVGYGYIQGHKYLISYMAKADQSVGLTLRSYTADGDIFSTTPSLIMTSDYQLAAYILTAQRTGTCQLRFTNASTTAATYDFKNAMVLDLTDIMGAGNEPATVAEFTALFPNFPYAFNAGTLLPFKGTGLKINGFNQWDEQWELGLYNYNTGQPTPSTMAIRSKNYTPCIGGMSYYFKVPGTSTLRILWYDADKNFISALHESDYNNKSQTAPANAAYLRIGLSSTYGTTYNHDICINLSNPALNGTYKPYTETLVNIDAIGKSAKDSGGNPIVPFPEGMNGTPTVYDVATKDGGTLAQSRVALNTLSWAVSGSFGAFYASLPVGAIEDTRVGNMICNKYPVLSASISVDTPDKTISGWGSSRRIYIKDTSYGTVDDFVASLEGVELVYPLATPVPFTWDEPLEMVAPVEEGGVLWLQPEGVDEQGIPATAPLSADIKWPFSVSSIDGTLANLLDALKTAGVITAYTMTYNAATGKYDFTIN